MRSLAVVSAASVIVGLAAIVLAVTLLVVHGYAADADPGGDTTLIADWVLLSAGVIVALFGVAVMAARDLMTGGRFSRR